MFILQNHCFRLREISQYASVSLQTSVLIIGGFTSTGIGQNSGSTSLVVEFKDDKWTIIGNLKQRRSHHQAILMGSLIMVVGGFSKDVM